MAAPHSWFVVHGFALWAAWSLIGLYQIATNRWFKHKWQTNMWLHRIGGVFILITTIFYALHAVKKAGWTIWAGAHPKMGVIVLSFVTFIAASGIVARSRLNRAVTD